MKNKRSKGDIIVVACMAVLFVGFFAIIITGFILAALSIAKEGVELQPQHILIMVLMGIFTIMFIFWGITKLMEKRK